jgi:branched-chain amino acid transport system substrate-binding protein
MANYLFKLLQPRSGRLTAYVVDDAEVYGIGLATSFIKEWQKLNGSITAYKHDANPNDYQSMVQPMLANPPDVVFFGGRTDRGAEEFYKAMKNNNIAQKTVYAGGSGLISPPDFIGIVSPITNPIYASFPFVDVENLPNATNFIDHFERVEGVSSYGKYTAAGYDSANVLIQAIKVAIHNGVQPPRSASDARSAKAFRQAVTDAIKSISYTGITGPISFDANGDTNDRVLTIYSVVGGQADWKCLEQVTIGNASTVKWLNGQGANSCPLKAL